MIARTHRRFTSGRGRTPTRSLCPFESLEARTLFSAWSTVDNPASPTDGLTAMAADKQGNVYTVGDVLDSSGDDYVLRAKAANSSSWTTLYRFGDSTSYRTYLSGIAVDAQGDVFVAGGGASASWTLWELPHGSSTPVIIDTSSGSVSSVAVDPAGNVYEAGHLLVSVKNVLQNQWAVRKGTFNSTTGSWTFSTVDHLTTASGAAGVGIVTTTTTGGPPSTAAYVVGSVGSSWVVRRSVNGGAWSQVDSFREDSTGSAASAAVGVASDLTGNVYVVGNGQKATVTGYTKNHTPTYSYARHWIVRKSTNGGDSWNPDDDASYFASATGNNEAMAICTNPQSGAVDVAGYMYDSANVGHAIVRTNAGGSWSIVDDYTGSAASGAWYRAIAADPAGNLYAGGASDDGGGSWFIRSRPAAPTNLNATADPVLPSSQIDLAWTNAAGTDATGFAVYRSTDGVNFTLLGTVDASVTGYTDGGLAAGTTYYYYVKTLLNSDGVSDASAIVGATTSA